MKNTYIDAAHRAEARRVWGLHEYTLNFRNRERYKKAVRVLMNSERYKLLRNGRYLGGPEYGYVTFTKRASA